MGWRPERIGYFAFGLVADVAKAGAAVVVEGR